MLAMSTGYGDEMRPTGGISFGSSTSLVITVFPFLIGHSKSTLVTCSHRSVFWLTRRINPYLTCKIT